MLKKNHKNSSLMENLQAPAFLAKSLSDENRLRILLCISNRKKSVSAIVEELQLSQPLVSHHLRTLKDHDVLETKRKGPFVYYKLKNTKLLDVLGFFAEIAPVKSKRSRDNAMFQCPPWIKKF